MITFRTYAAVWKWEPRIYRLERIRLPMPVTFRWVGLAVGSLFLVVIPLNKLLLDHLLPWAPVRYVLLPILIANGLTKARLDGKPPLAWLGTMATYLVMPKRWACYRPVKPGRRQAFTARVTRRRPYLEE